MYPHGDLELLRLRKAELRRRIAGSRLECIVSATEVTRPLAYLDQAMAIWRQLQPMVRLAAVPLGLLVVRAVRRRIRTMGSLLSWGSLVFSVLRGCTSAAGEPSERRQPVA